MGTRKKIKVVIDLARYHQLGAPGPTLRLPVRVPVLTVRDVERQREAAACWARMDAETRRQKRLRAG